MSCWLEDLLEAMFEPSPCGSSEDKEHHYDRFFIKDGTVYYACRWCGHVPVHFLNEKAEQRFLSLAECPEG